MSVLLLVIGLLVLVIVGFYFVDLYLKSSSKAKTPKSEIKSKIVPEEVNKQLQTEVPQDTCVPLIYNSDLADELDNILKNQPTNVQNRIEVPTRLRREGNISKYVTDKKYHTFDFGSVDEMPEQENHDENEMTFTKEDYKKIMAFSNIDPKQ